MLGPALERIFAEEERHGAPKSLMCGEDESGEKLEHYGHILDERGNPLPKAMAIAYSTDAEGLYVPRGSLGRSPRIHGVAATDADGWYRFRTIRPGGYPGSDDPQHVHLHIDAAVHRHTCRTMWFDDDPCLTADIRRSLDAETKIISLRKHGSSLLAARLDVRLEGS